MADEIGEGWAGGRRVDVAVVGLGAMGSAVLYQLARRGLRAVGLDRHAPPHTFGSSHGESRITRQGVGEGQAYVPLVVASQRIWRALEAETGLDLFVQCGALVVGPGAASRPGSQDFTARSIDAAARNGIAHELFDGAEAARRFPMFVGFRGDETAYYEAGGGYLRPEACIAAQLALATALGATVLTGTQVLGLAQEGTGVRIETPDGPVVADRAIVAAGAWTPPLLGAPFDRLLTVSRQVLHWFHLDDMSAYGASSPVFIWMHGATDPDYVYGFPPFPGDSRLKVAGEQHASTTTAGTVDRRVDPSESAALYRGGVAGGFAGVTPRVAATAACLYTVTPDRGFIVDRHPDMDRVLVVSACSGHGFKHSAGLGAAVAQLVAEGRSAIDLAPFALGRFR